MRQGWLEGRYPAAAAMVIFALVPYLGLSAALGPLTPIIDQRLHMSAQTMSLGLGMANAGYAVGTVLAVQFAQLLPQRRMMVLYAVLLTIGSIVAAAAQGPLCSSPGTCCRAMHEPPPDRRRAAFGTRLRPGEVPLDGDDHERLHLRRRRARACDRWDPGERRRVAATVLDRRRDRAHVAPALPVDIRGRSARQPGRPASPARDRSGSGGMRCRVLWRLRAGGPTASSAHRPSCRSRSACR